MPSAPNFNTASRSTWARTDLAGLKARTDLRSLVAETHVLRGDKVHCPFHDDAHPSCHIYPDGYKCFGCGAHGDHIRWLQQVRGLSAAEAIRSLAGLASPRPFTRPARPSRPAPSRRYRAIGDADLADYQVRLRATHHLALALAGRGLELSDALSLGIAAVGEDALLPIFGPRGDILALKWRVHEPRSKERYRYATPGQGSPAWCSPGIAAKRDLLIVEGELNAMLCWLSLRAAGAEVGVMGVAGAYGGLHRELLPGKRVFVWADADEAGRAARRRWLLAARWAGCRARAISPGIALGVAPGLLHDACDIAGSQGRLALAALLLGALRRRPESGASRSSRVRG